MTRTIEVAGGRRDAGAGCGLFPRPSIPFSKLYIPIRSMNCELISRRTFAIIRLSLWRYRKCRHFGTAEKKWSGLERKEILRQSRRREFTLEVPLKSSPP
ncbi:unnamed protein product [Victoria cruziana]